MPFLKDPNFNLNNHISVIEKLSPDDKELKYHNEKKEGNQIEKINNLINSLNWLIDKNEKKQKIIDRL